MLCVIRQRDNKKALAPDESKSNSPFVCPRCAAEVILKKGSVKTHHFAHWPLVLCEYGQGETEEHRKCKLAIYEGLTKFSRFQDVQIEKDLGTVRPDVSAFMDGIQIAIEVQISTLTMDQIICRTTEYLKKGIFVLWLAVYDQRLQSDRYSPKLWERWVHAAYFGRVYYWVGGLDVIPYHFSDCHHYVESRSWFTKDGDERFGGGYDKKYKRFKTLENGTVVSLSDSFVPKYRKIPWQSKVLTVPESRLLIDTQPVWWQNG